MTPQEFIVKWQAANLTERSAAQQHFLDICALLGQPTPAQADPDGAFYTFERGAKKTDGGDGWADVWMKGHFGWEYKGKHKDLAAAYRQLLQYHEALESPPLLVVCDLDRFQIHTKFTGTVKKVYEFNLDGLAEPANLDVLRRVFTDPESLKPGLTAEVITRVAAERIGQIADSMYTRKIPAPRAAHFLMKLMFCMFAEDIGLLPEKLFSRILANSKHDPPRLAKQLTSLFTAMAHGGDFGAETVLHFNGGLFADADVIEPTVSEIQHLSDANIHNWADVEPSIFGTLFERTLDPAKRSQIGAHYTSREDILTLLEPVVMAPLRKEWAGVREKCDALWPKIQEEARKQVKVGVPRKASKPRATFDNLVSDFVHRLAHVRILDPACGSGNFLYVAINLLLDLEKEVIAYGASHGLTQLPQVRPTQLAGIEINPYAQELAQVVIWIGYIQWMHHNGFNPPRNPVLDPIESIQCKDAILDLTDPEHPSEPEWPEADFVVGNPPFLGDKMMRGGLGDEYVERLRKLYAGRLPGQSDLCCYWFEKSRAQIEAGKCRRAGLLATQGIRGGANRTALERIKGSGDIFWAFSDRNWILDGAIVHVSMVGFDDGTEPRRFLDSEPVMTIHSNLAKGTGNSPTITTAKLLAENSRLCFLGVMKAGPFDISETSALEMAKTPNAAGRPNSNVLRPRVTARDILQRLDVGWIVDFGCDAGIRDASFYESPWRHVEQYVKPVRLENRRKRLATDWWIHGESRPGLRKALTGLARFIVTPEVSKHRIFSWLDAVYLADHQTRAFPRADDYFFGVLHSRIHECWARAQGTQLRERESGFRYTPTSCFETFPLPEPTPAQREAIAAAACEIDRLRNAWLNPPEWTREEILEFPGSADGPWRRYLEQPDARGIGTVRYPRLIPKDADSAKQLAKRTLTNLYNERPTWLDLAHRKLDEAVFAAYRWTPDLTDDQILERLLALNLERSAT